MTVWNKTGNSSWTEIKSIFNKTGSSSWTEILGVWVKTASSTWTRVFTRVLVPANTVEPSVTGSQYLHGLLQMEQIAMLVNGKDQHLQAHQ